MVSKEAVQRANDDPALRATYATHWNGCDRPGATCFSCTVYTETDEFNTLYRKKTVMSVGTQYKTATSTCPYGDPLVTLISPGSRRFAKTKEEKIQLLLAFQAGDTILVAWPGEYSQDIFAILTVDQRDKALTRLGLRPKTTTAVYKAADGTVFERL